METYIKIVFSTEDGRELAFTINNVKDDVSKAEVGVLMDALKDSNALESGSTEITENKYAVVYKVSKTDFVVKELTEV